MPYFQTFALYIDSNLIHNKWALVQLIGAEQATNHYLNQWWASSLINTCIWSTYPWWVYWNVEISWRDFAPLSGPGAWHVFCKIIKCILTIILEKWCGGCGLVFIYVVKWHDTMHLPQVIIFCFLISSVWLSLSLFCPNLHLNLNRHQFCLVVINRIPHGIPQTRRTALLPSFTQWHGKPCAPIKRNSIMGNNALSVVSNPRTICVLNMYMIIKLKR